MALRKWQTSRADYRHCDVCDCKVFYDSELNYEQGRGIPKEEMARVAGKENPCGYKLGCLGDWAVLCRDCAKTHRCVIEPIPTTPADMTGGEE